MYDANEQKAREDRLTTWIISELVAGRPVRYGYGRNDVITAEDVKAECGNDALRAAFEEFMAGDSVEAGRIFASEWSSAIGRVAQRNTGLVMVYREWVAA